MLSVLQRGAEAFQVGSWFDDSALTSREASGYPQHRQESSLLLDSELVLCVWKGLGSCSWLLQPGGFRGLWTVA